MEDDEVPLCEIVKGYEIAPERYVVVEADEFATLEPVHEHVEIEDFVEIEEIDPILFEPPYILAPGEGAAAVQPPARGDAPHGQGRDRPRRDPLEGAPRGDPWGEALLMSTMSFSDEIQEARALPEIGDSTPA